MDTKFTPGPWQSQHEFDSEGLMQIIGNVDGPDDGQYHYTRVCIVDDNTNDGEAAANAHLIAAAPELYEALQKIADSHIPDAPSDSVGDELVWAQRHVGKLRGFAERALRKARGESQ
jgi:hypothetical protein